jgi:VanZ family protein
MQIQNWKPFIFFLIVLAVITYGSLESGETAEKLKIFNFKHSDKIVHAMMYFLLTISLVYGMVKKKGIFKNWKVYLVVLVTPIIYGILMEILQFMVTTTRHAESADFAANLAGTGIAFLFAYVYHSLK